MTTPPLAPTSTSAVPRPLDAAEPRERTPWLLGFFCLLIPILPAFSVLPGPLKSNGSPQKMIAVLFFGLALLGYILVRRTASTRTVRPGVVIILLYFSLWLAVYGMGLTHLGSVLVEGNRTRGLINLVATVGVVLYILSRVRTARQRNFVLGCLATGLAFACLVGLLQSLTNIDLRLFFHPPGFVVNTENLTTGERWGARRVAGTSQHAIEFSVLAAVTLPLTLYFARYAAKRQVRYAAVLVFGLAFVAMPAGGSRTGIIALGAALLVYMWNFKVRQLGLALVAGSAMVVSYIIIFPGTAHALWVGITGAREDDSILTRIADYAQVSQTFRENPVFGIGLGGAPPTEYGFLDNEWLQAIVQGGAVGLTAMIVLAGGGIFGFAAALRSARTPRERDQAYVLGSIFVAVMISSFTFDLFGFQQATLILFIIFGLLWSNFTVSLPSARAITTGSY